jgi:integrase/recombinase XerD
MQTQAIIVKQHTDAVPTIGLFGDYLERFRQNLIDQHYGPGTITTHIRCIDVLAEAMKANALIVGELDEAQAVELIAKAGWMRERSTYPALIVKRFVRFLVDQGVARPPLPPTAKELSEEELRRDYLVYLRRQRGVCERTVSRSWRFVSKFLNFRFGNEIGDLSKISPSDAIRFMQHPTTRTPPFRDKTVSSNMRSFFRYLFQTGKMANNLALTIPSVAQRYGARLPRHLAPEQVEILLKDIRREAPRCKRNYAMVLLLARLGLRPQEVIAIQIDDIDWRSGEIMVRGKGARHDRLPLTPEVGEALAEYIRLDRITTSRTLFVSERTPHRPFKDAQVLNSVLKSAYTRTGLKPPAPYVGAHVLRHSLATNLVRRGASLEEISDMLRHRSRASTMIYARLDIDGLRSIAQPWPAERGAE